jgi:hypothetical protein
VAEPKRAGNVAFAGRKRVRGSLGAMGIHPEQQIRRRIALIAHDNKKSDLAEWARFNRALLAEHDLCATGTTGQLLGSELSACR